MLPDHVVRLGCHRVEPHRGRLLDEALALARINGDCYMEAVLERTASAGA
jgi:hypothetical protein